MNSYDLGVDIELHDAVQRIRFEHPEVKAVVVTSGKDRMFCAGANIKMLAASAHSWKVNFCKFTNETRNGIEDATAHSGLPFIAAVNGTAAGAGAHLVLACDLVVMADTARLIEVFVKRGIIPDAGGAYLLPRIVGPQRTKELMFLGDDLAAADCERWGIANRVVPAAELGATVDELAGRLAAAPSKAIAMTKWLVNRSFESSRQAAFEEEAYAQELVTATADMAEGIAAFGERRAPGFKGW
jgi:2-(1,2-epoxy-1,2-dihydrophenyl)acetyl-CoA isomerase